MESRFETFAGSVLELSRCLQKIKEMEMQQFGLKASHAMCLYHLGLHPEGLTATSLTELCKEDKAAVSRCLSQLAGKGLILSAPPSDKRAYRTLIFLSDKGKEVTGRINEIIDNALLFGSEGLDEEMRNAFYSSLEKILSNLTAYIKIMEEGKGK